MSRDLGPCLYCAEPAGELHHWTAGLVPDGPYLDVGSTVALCIACHHAEHSAWREQGMERFRDPLEARLVRLGWLLLRLADVAELDGPPAFDVRSLRGIQQVVMAIAADLGTRQGWSQAQ